MQLLFVQTHRKSIIIIFGHQLESIGIGSKNAVYIFLADINYIVCHGLFHQHQQQQQRQASRWICIRTAHSIPNHRLICSFFVVLFCIRLRIFDSIGFISIHSNHQIQLDGVFFIRPHTIFNILSTSDFGTLIFQIVAHSPMWILNECAINVNSPMKNYLFIIFFLSTCCCSFG